MMTIPKYYIRIYIKNNMYFILNIIYFDIFSKNLIFFVQNYLIYGLY